MAKKKKEAPKEAVMETVQCTCSNVHLGNGLKLTATQNKHGNWVDGETAQVSHADAVFMESNGQVKIL
jgi:hypothetical protein